MRKLYHSIFKHYPRLDLLRKMSWLKKDFLNKSGWKRSILEQAPVDSKGNPIPWYTYPSIKFLTKRLNKKLNVFEFGSGNSTFWLAKRVKYVVSVEHDQSWFENVKSKIKLNKIENVHYNYKSLHNQEYAKSVTSDHAPYDIIVIDGRDRVACAQESLRQLSQDGVIIWDNADRDLYEEGYSLLVEAGFKRLDFWGLGPLNEYEWCTAIFYKSNNCLGI